MSPSPFLFKLSGFTFFCFSHGTDSNPSLIRRHQNFGQSLSVAFVLRLFRHLNISQIPLASTSSQISVSSSSLELRRRYHHKLLLRFLCRASTSRVENDDGRFRDVLDYGGGEEKLMLKDEEAMPKYCKFCEDLQTMMNIINDEVWEVSSLELLMENGLFRKWLGNVFDSWLVLGQLGILFWFTVTGYGMVMAVYSIFLQVPFIS
ncbi:unnamed protein product [Vicia faba]|uniref:Uncharacterized protein n=1 Tax=Vicia faba TaxID=3906 RepID=A0AAV0YK93_VICFA|nr:unnamed protein product [Vicia faba]